MPSQDLATAAPALHSNAERYELLGELASGGMATVYLARMRRPMGFSRLVAIECMHPQFAKDPSFVSMFMDEARLTARLRHPNIVPTVDIVADEGHLLLVMEYVEGASLAHLLRAASRAGTRVPVPIACAIIHDLLLGLQAAHQAEDDDGAPLAIVHRDVSPQNVLVGLDGLSRVLDFGVARARQNTHHTNDNEIKGKVPYMPPEQLFGEAIDHKVDVYAAGVSLWETLVCERLFEGPSETMLVRKISEEPVPRPSERLLGLPPELDAIVMRALARDAKDRFASALAMAEAIAAVVPLPTRTEISAWVRQHIAPCEVPSGKVSLSAPHKEEVATTILALLERASLLRPSARRPAVEVSAPPSSRATSSGLRRFAIGVGVSAVLLAGVSVFRLGARSAEAAPRHPVESSPVGPAAPAPAPVVPGKAATPDEKPASEPKPALRPAPRRATPPPMRTAVVNETANEGAKPKECKIPFTIDANGHKHYKVECIP